MLAPADVLTPRGHAIECRIYAEDPDTGFRPSPGRITSLRTPSGPGIRDDGWVEEGTEVTTYYDSLLSKLIAWGVDRTDAIARMRRALSEYEVAGIRTTVPFFHWMLAQPAFVDASVHTSYLDELLHQRQIEFASAEDLSLAEVASVMACLARASASGVLDDRLRSANRQDEVMVAPARSWKMRGRLEGLRG
jgi:acetyl-CoA carboxylase biotin carboxylase subunit